VSRPSAFLGESTTLSYYEDSSVCQEIDHCYLIIKFDATCFECFQEGPWSLKNSNEQA